MGAPDLNCGIWDLVPWPGIKLRSWVLVTGPPGKSQGPFQLYGSSLSAWLFPANLWPLPYRPSHVYTHQSHSFSKQIRLCLFPAYCFTWFPAAYGALLRLACENLAPERSGAPPHSSSQSTSWKHLFYIQECNCSLSCTVLFPLSSSRQELLQTACRIGVQLHVAV